MSFKFGGLPCLDPASLPPLAKAALRGRRVNVYDCPLGCRPGFADLVVLRWHLNQLNLKLPEGSMFRELVIFDSNNVKLVFPHFVVTGHATALCPGAPDDETTPYLLRVADKRWLHWDRGEKINAAYNVRSITDGEYYPGTLKSDSGSGDSGSGNSGGGSPWTWQEILTDLWPDGMGTCPDLPFTPNGTPEGFWYEGVSKWQAVEDFLNRLCCKVKYDPFDDTSASCSIIRLGEDATVDKYLKKFEKARVWDEYPVTGRIASWPEKIRVQFRVRAPYEDGSMPFYTIDQTVTTFPAQGDAPGTMVVIDDDLYARSDAGTISNVTELTTRATERRTDWERKRLSYDTGKMISYVGALNMMPAIGGKWGRIVWKEDEAGATTTIAAGVNDDTDVWHSKEWYPERASGSSGSMAVVEILHISSAMGAIADPSGLCGSSGDSGDSGSGSGPCLSWLHIGKLKTYDVDCDLWRDGRCVWVIDIEGGRLQKGKRYFADHIGDRKPPVEAAFAIPAGAECEGLDDESPLYATNMGNPTKMIYVTTIVGQPCPKDSGSGSGELPPTGGCKTCNDDTIIVYKGNLQTFDDEACVWETIEEGVYIAEKCGRNLAINHRYTAVYHGLLPTLAEDQEDPPIIESGGYGRECKPLYMTDCPGFTGFRTVAAGCGDGCQTYDETWVCGHLVCVDGPKDDSGGSGSGGGTGDGGSTTPCCNGRSLPDTLYATGCKITIALEKTTCNLNDGACCPGNPVWQGSGLIECGSLLHLRLGCDGQKYVLCATCDPSQGWTPAIVTLGHQQICDPLSVGPWVISLPSLLGPCNENCTGICQIVVTE